MKVTGHMSRGEAPQGLRKQEAKRIVVWSMMKLSFLGWRLTEKPLEQES